MYIFNNIPSLTSGARFSFLITKGPKATISQDVFPLHHSNYLSLGMWGDHTLTGHICKIRSFQFKSNTEKKLQKAWSSTWNFPMPAGHTHTVIHSIHLRLHYHLMLWLKCQLRFKDCCHKHPWHTGTNTQNTSTASIRLGGVGVGGGFCTHNIFSLRVCFLYPWTVLLPQ